jgi:protein TonB
MQAHQGNATMEAKNAVLSLTFVASLICFDASAQSVERQAEVVSRVEPVFPVGAARAQAENGLVKARMTLDAAGNVINVEVLDSRPKLVFDRSVIDALSQWKFNTGPAGRKVETEVAFSR